MSGIGRLLIVELREFKRYVIISLLFSFLIPISLYFLYIGTMKYTNLSTGRAVISTTYIVISTVVILLPMLFSIYYWMKYLNRNGIIISELGGEYKLFELFLTKLFIHVIYCFVNIAIFSFLLILFFKINLIFSDFILIVLLIFLISVTQYIVGLFLSSCFQNRAGDLISVVLAYLVIFVIPGLLGIDAEINDGTSIFSINPILYIPFLNLFSLFRSLFLFNNINYYLLWYTIAIDIVLIFVGYFFVKKKLFG